MSTMASQPPLHRVSSVPTFNLEGRRRKSLTWPGLGLGNLPWLHLYTMGPSLLSWGHLTPPRVKGKGGVLKRQRVGVGSGLNPALRQIQPFGLLRQGPSPRVTVCHTQPPKSHNSLVHVNLPVGHSGDIQVGEAALAVLGVNTSQHQLPSRLPAGIPGREGEGNSISVSHLQHRRACAQHPRIQWAMRSEVRR